MVEKVGGGRRGGGDKGERNKVSVVGAVGLVRPVGFFDKSSSPRGSFHTNGMLCLEKQTFVTGQRDKLPSACHATHS